MMVRVAQTRIAQIDMVIALVEASMIGPLGDTVIQKLSPFFPGRPAMLVCVSQNGFLAHAHFKTAQLLALLQLVELSFSDIDVDSPPEQELPF